MNEAVKARHQVWSELLLDPANSDKLMRLVGSVPQALLTRCFLRLFPTHDPVIFAITGKKAKQVRAEDVVANIERIRERRPRALETLVDVLVAGFVENVEQRAQKDGDRALLSLLAWLWTKTEDAPPATWDLVLALAEQAEPPAATNAQGRSEVPDPDGVVLTELRRQVLRLQRAQRLTEARYARRQKAAESQAQAHRALRERCTELEAARSAAEARADQAAASREQAEARAASEVAKLEVRLSRAKERYSDIESRHREVQSQLLDEQKVTAGLNQLRVDHAALQAEYFALHRVHKDLEQDRRPPALPDGAAQLGAILVIDYAALGREPRVRLDTLIALYEAALASRPTPELERHTNWSALERGHFAGLLLCEVEMLLEDMSRMPIRGYLATQALAYEEILRTYLPRVPSPRLAADHDE